MVRGGGRGLKTLAFLQQLANKFHFEMLILDSELHFNDPAQNSNYGQYTYFSHTFAPWMLFTAIPMSHPICKNRKESDSTDPNYSLIQL